MSQDFAEPYNYGFNMFLPKHAFQFFTIHRGIIYVPNLDLPGNPSPNCLFKNPEFWWFSCIMFQMFWFICFIYIIISFYPLFSTPSIFANNPPLHPSRMSYDFPATFSVFPASWVELVQWAAWSHAAAHYDLWSVPVRQRRDYGYLSGELVSQH